MKLNQEEVESLYCKFKSMKKVAKFLSVTYGAIQKRLAKGSVVVNHNKIWDKNNDNKLKELYSSGLGYMKCGQHFGVSEYVIQHACKRLKINDPSRAFTKKHTSNAERSYKRRPFEFSQLTKKFRFEQEQGVCQWCHELIESKFKATYHHIQMIDSGGDGSPENCMVLHRKCHIGNFEALHNGRKYEFGLHNREFTPKIKKEIDYIELAKELEEGELKDWSRWKKFELRKTLKSLGLIKVCDCGDTKLKVLGDLNLCWVCWHPILKKEQETLSLLELSEKHLINISTVSFILNPWIKGSKNLLSDRLATISE